MFKKSIYYGGIAQLGERLNGIQKVSGSIPLTSTNNKEACNKMQVFLLQIFSSVLSSLL